MSFGVLNNCGMYLNCAIDTQNKSDQLTYSSEFHFMGYVWRLYYCYKGEHILGLAKEYSVPVRVTPFRVFVELESSGTGRIVKVLTAEKLFTNEFQFQDSKLQRIWVKKHDEILRAAPEFRLYEILKVRVILKTGDLLTADSDSKALQAECGVPEAAGQSSSTRSTSVQTTLLMNGTPCLESLSNDLAQMMVDDSHHDVEFQCAGLTTKAHKSIVCKRSPVIASMLSTDMVEGRTGVVNIPNMEPDIFTLFMRYIYSGQLEELTFDTALRLYEAGDQYEVLGLAKRCSEFLVENLSVDNAYEQLVVADAHSNKEFVEKVVDYMVDRRIPRTSDRWSAFADDHPKLAIKVLNRVWDELLK